ncbi:LysR family transcriptional regulator, partial [Providencia rettgeri]
MYLSGWDDVKVFLAAFRTNSLRGASIRLSMDQTTVSRRLTNLEKQLGAKLGTVAKLAMRQPFVLFKGLTFQKLCLP